MNFSWVFKVPTVRYGVLVGVLVLLSLLLTKVLDKNTIEVTDDTEFIQSLLDLGGHVVIPSRTYHVRPDVLTIPSNTFVEGQKGAVLAPLVEKGLSRANPSGLLLIRGRENIRIANIEFIGIGSRSVAIKVLPDLKGPSKGIEVAFNRARNIGLIWVAPEEGFSFNKTGEAFRGWGHSGPVLQLQIAEDIRIISNYVTGDAQFVNGHFAGKTSSVSGISLLYVKGAYVYDNHIDNFNFGIWAYGGASRNSDQSRLSDNPYLCANIEIRRNRVTNTFGSIWGSRCSALNMVNNEIYNNYDVAIDYEGSRNSYASGNVVIDSRGGALTALNGSDNIRFINNQVYTKPVSRVTNVILIRDGNRNITYRDNRVYFLSGGLFDFLFHGRIFLTESSSDIRANSEITFEGNSFYGVQLEARSAGRIKVEDNSFIFRRDDKGVQRFPNDHVEMSGNKVNAFPVSSERP